MKNYHHQFLRQIKRVQGKGDNQNWVMRLFFDTSSVDTSRNLGRRPRCQKDDNEWDLRRRKKKKIIPDDWERARDEGYFLPAKKATVRHVFINKKAHTFATNILNVNLRFFWKLHLSWKGLKRRDSSIQKIVYISSVAEFSDFFIQWTITEWNFTFETAVQLGTQEARGKKHFYDFFPNLLSFPHLRKKIQFERNSSHKMFV